MLLPRNLVFQQSFKSSFLVGFELIMPAPLWKNWSQFFPLFFLYSFQIKSSIFFSIFGIRIGCHDDYDPFALWTFWASDHWDGWRFMSTFHRSLQFRSLNVAGWFNGLDSCLLPSCLIVVYIEPMDLRQYLGSFIFTYHPQFNFIFLFI